MSVGLAVIFLRLSFLPLIPVPLPGIHDEFGYLLEADTFLHGRLANPPHPLWGSFETFHVNWFPAYSAMFPPAQGFALAVGKLLGHPWIGVLLSVTAMCSAFVWMLQGWMPARWALLGGAIAGLKLGLVSYWVNSYWGGAVAATGGALVLGALPRLFRRRGTRDALLLGLGIAILANSRPMEGLILCVPVAIAFLVWLLGKNSTPVGAVARPVLLPLAGVLVLAGTFIGYYNWRLTGNPLLLPHLLNRQRYQSTGLFLWQEARPPLHYDNRQFEEFYNGWARNNYHGTWEDIKRVSREKVERYAESFFWLGAVPLFLGIPLCWRERRMRLLIVVCLVSTAGLFSVVWSMPHYAAPVICAVYALLIQSLRHLRTFRLAGRRLGIGVSRMIVILLLMNVGVDCYQRVHWPYRWGWNGYMGDVPRAKMLKRLEQTPGKHLVVVRYEQKHNIHQEWVFNNADIDGDKVVWARELSEKQNRRLMEYFKDRQVWLAEPDTKDPEIKPYRPLEN